MKATKVFMLLSFFYCVTGGMNANADDAKKICQQDFEHYTYVPAVMWQSGDACIPVNPCSASDAQIREKYCIKSINDIDVWLDGTFSLECHVAEYKDSGKSCGMTLMGNSKTTDDSDCEYVGLTPGMWMSRFPYGTVKGQSICSAQKAIDFNNLEYSNSEKRVLTYDGEKLKSEQGEKRYCWCKADALYTLMTDTNPREKFKGPWVYMYDENNERSCNMDCADKCRSAMLKPANKSAIFFGKQREVLIQNPTKATQLCMEKYEDYVYVQEKDLCIPVDVCDAARADAHEYCVKSIDDIDYKINGTHSRAYSWRVPFGRTDQAYEQCEITLISVGGVANWWGNDCSVVGLKYNDWMVRFPYGTVKGQSMCSGQNGGVDKYDYNAGSKKVWTDDENKLRNAHGDKKFCWCKANGLYNAMTDTNPKLSFKSNAWVLVFESRDSELCEDSCANTCAQQVVAVPNVRLPMFFGK